MAGLGYFVGGLAQGVETGMRFGLMRRGLEREEKELTLMEDYRNTSMDNTTLDNFFKVADKSIDPEALQTYLEGIKFKNPASKILGQAYLSADAPRRKASKDFFQDISNVLGNSDSPDALDKAMNALHKFGAIVGTDNNAYKAAEKQITYLKEKGVKEDEATASRVADVFRRNKGAGGIESGGVGLIPGKASEEDVSFLAQTQRDNPTAYEKGVGKYAETFGKLKEPSVTPSVVQDIEKDSTTGRWWITDRDERTGETKRVRPATQREIQDKVERKPAAEEKKEKLTISDVKSAYSMEISNIKNQIMIDMTPDEQISLAGQPPENIFALLAAGRIGKSLPPEKKSYYMDRLQAVETEYGGLTNQVLGRKGAKIPSVPKAPGKQVAGKPLDKDMAAAILKEAGGNKTKARNIAKQRGYVF